MHDVPLALPAGGTTTPTTPSGGGQPSGGTQGGGQPSGGTQGGAQGGGGGTGNLQSCFGFIRSSCCTSQAPNRCVCAGNSNRCQFGKVGPGTAAATNRLSRCRCLPSSAFLLDPLLTHFVLPFHCRCRPAATLWSTAPCSTTRCRPRGAAGAELAARRAAAPL
jgi:hypothetical protein